MALNKAMRVTKSTPVVSHSELSVLRELAIEKGNPFTGFSYRGPKLSEEFNAALDRPEYKGVSGPNRLAAHLDEAIRKNGYGKQLADAAVENGANPQLLNWLSQRLVFENDLFRQVDIAKALLEHHGWQGRKAVLGALDSNNQSVRFASITHLPNYLNSFSPREKKVALTKLVERAVKDEAPIVQDRASCVLAQVMNGHRDNRLSDEHVESTLAYLRSSLASSRGAVSAKSAEFSLAVAFAKTVEAALSRKLVDARNHQALRSFAGQEWTFQVFCDKLSAVLDRNKVEPVHSGLAPSRALTPAGLRAIRSGGKQGRATAASAHRGQLAA